MTEHALFPDEPRTHDRFRNVNESIYTYCRQSASEQAATYRGFANEWFEHYPEEHRSAFRGRFCGSRNDQHNAAFFELFLYDLFSRFCEQITIETAMPDSDKRADFGLRFADDTEIMVEAMSIQPTLGVSKPNVETIRKHIREMRSSDFAIRLGFESGELTTTLSKRRVQRWVHNTLGAHKWHDTHVSLEGTGSRFIAVEPLREGGWEIEASLYVNSPDERIERTLLHPLGGFEGGPYDLPQRIRSKIVKKIRVKNVAQDEAPLILAVNISDRMFYPGREELEILHGYKPTIQIPSPAAHDWSDREGARASFSSAGREGVWSTKDDQSQYSRCDAIWFFHEVWMAYPRGRRHAMYLHPFIEHDHKMLFLHHFATADFGLPEQTSDDKEFLITDEEL